MRGATESQRAFAKGTGKRGLGQPSPLPEGCRMRDTKGPSELILQLELIMSFTM